MNCVHSWSTSPMAASTSTERVISGMGPPASAGRSGPPARPPSQPVRPMIAESPTPHLPRGAGGPLRRAAGRVIAEPPAALVARAGSADAAPGRLGRRRRSGLRVPDEAERAAARASRPRVVFVPLARRRLPRALRRARRAPRRPGAARRRLRRRAAGAARGAPRPPLRRSGPAAHGRRRRRVLRPPAGADEVTAAGLTEREADVLVLLLARADDAGHRRRLCVSPSTARTHCRAVLRKLGAGDRRALRARLLGALGVLRRPPAPRFA